MVFTGHKANPSSNKEVIEKEQASSNYITVQEVDDLDSEIKLVETPKTLDDGGQATIDELMELNLGTPKESCPIYVISLLTLEEEKEYFNLLSEYKMCFHGATKRFLG